ncbi:MAG: hypothetical protein EX271_12100 [Acidimicrobiales bacterium]|nr:hypothetical protein [Hyphomonadaceae bacterium]RZV36598.1 MAG: hypothetical protein EX271_12100 [Acidimicrobiales bacterium]
MMRLVRRGLMYGNLIEISSPAMVARYNRALKHLINKETELTEFHIDISGFSPEIGDEFGDNLYLNHLGFNRQFILMTTDQKTAPLLNSHFSTSRSILRDFIEENEDQLFALTAREAVAGEMLNSVFKVDTPKDLFQINQIQIEADTVQSHVKESKALAKHIEDFMKRDDAWWDDVLIAQMIEMAKRTGNIQRNPIKLKSMTYEQGNYYTTHFGGIYVFRDLERPTVIMHDPSLPTDDLPVDYALDIKDRKSIAQLMYDLKLTELIVSAPDEEAAAILQQKLDFITIATAANEGDKLKNMTRQQMRHMSRKYASKMPPEYKGLMEMWRWASMGGTFPELEPEDPAYFYAFRSSQHKNKDLINMLLAELSPLDFRQLFICHKDAFYNAYRSWSDPKREYVSKFLADEYVIDKAGAREELFGPEPSMQDGSAKLRVDPWGSAINKRWKK